MKNFVDTGHEVRALLADADFEVELARNETRAEEEGLRFDPFVVEELGLGAARRFREWRVQPWISRWEIYSTSATEGRRVFVLTTA